ncbi:MAG: glycosyltransferase family 4 protein [Deltaproteobacteria bacterium]|nr:glycosyltransferase family 1 protein [Candidatus Deferrimicrobiaceae bacterium]
MKIGVMLRHYDQHGGGVKVYTENLLRSFLPIAANHEIVLLYRNARLMGSHNGMDHVREVAIPSPSIFLWDQVAMRWAESREKFDVLFNPKYSIPLTARCKTVYVSHGVYWAALDLPKPWSDYIVHGVLRPRYARKADAIIAVSDTTRKQEIEYIGADEARVHTVYLGVDDSFRNDIPREQLENVRRTYGLPKRFFLYCGQIYPPKNFGRLLRAYARVGPGMGIHLVIAGEHRWLCKRELELVDRLNLSDWVVRPGWIGRETLPAFYRLSDALLLPSLYEACPSPPIEAMASGCPVVTSDRYGTKEIVDRAAVLVNPEDIDSIADGIRRIGSDDSLRRELIEKGKRRARFFSWEKCARETLQVLEGVAGG